MDYFDLPASNPHLFDNTDALLKIILDRQEIEAWERQRKNDLADQGKPAGWGEIGVMYEGPYIVVLRDLVEFPSGRRGSYFRIVNRADLNGGQGAAVLPVFEGKVLLLRQYRHAPRKWSWEVPRGFGEPGTPAEENAVKEVREEINGEVARLVDLGPYHNNTGAESGETCLYFAELSGVGAVDTDEGIEAYELFEVEELERMIAEAEITDGFTIAVYTRAKLRGLLKT